MGYCIAQTSLAHTYGNVTCFITEFIKSLFPKDYFKTIHISSTIAYKQFSIFQNTKKEFIRKKKPMLIIRPRVEINDSDTFLYNTFMTTRMTDNYMETSFTNLQEFIYDNERGNCMKFLLNRLKMFFDVTIVTETQLEQLNQAHYLKNRIRQDRPFFLETSLESFIPKELMEMMSKDIGIPIYDENKSIKPFLDYINGVSIYPISYKIKNSTGNDEFFRFYPVNIDTTISGLSIDDGSKRGFVSDSFTTTFTVSTEFNSAGLYYYFTEDPNFVSRFITSLEAGEEKKLIPLFTITNNPVERIGEGWNLYAAPIYAVERSQSIDETDLSSIFNNSITKCLEYHHFHGLDPDLFIKFVVTKDNERLIPNEDFEVDLKNLKLITKKINPDSTYRVFIHVNTFYVNDLISRVYELDAEK